MNGMRRNSERCSLKELREENRKLRERLADEKSRRVYYQNIVYGVCNILDAATERFCGTGVVCGTVREPSTEVQDTLRSLLQSMSQ